MGKRNDGKPLEKATAKAFKNLLDNNLAVMCRMYDTTSSGFFLPPSPSDFMGLFKGKPMIAECKSSDNKHTLADCNLKSYIEPTQYAYHKLWLKQGGLSLFIFHSVPMSVVELWHGSDVLRSYSGKQKLRVEHRIEVVEFKVNEIIKALKKLEV